MKEPFHLQWHITNLCPLRCKHCYQEDFSKDHDLDYSGLKKISNNLLSTLKKWDRLACIHLTGGEPLLKPEVFLLLEDLNQEANVGELGLITNGLPLNSQIIQKLSLFSKLRKIKISLDGADAEVNDAIRREGVFERVLQNISLLQEEGKFEIILMFTLMKRNRESLPSLLELCLDLGVDGLIFERFIPWGVGRTAMEEVLNKAEWRKFMETLFRFFSMKFDEKEFIPYQAFQVRFHGEEPELWGAPCVIGADGLCIMPEGTVFPCRRFPLSIGNLLDQSLKEIWEKNETLRRLRDKRNLKGKCGRCEMEGCRGCRSLAFSLTGDYLEEDPLCWYGDP